MDRGDATAMTRTPIALTIAGSDSGAGAGVQADLKTFAALGVYGASVVTALTAQNTQGVRAIHLAPPEIVAAQIEAVLEDFAVAAIKIGMLGSAEIAGVVAETLGLPSPQALARESPSRERASFDAPGGRAGASLLPLAGEGGRAKRGRMRAFIVYDPVMTASSGDALSGAGFVEAVRAQAPAARRLPDPQSRRGGGAARRRARPERGRHGAAGAGAASRSARAPS